MQNINPKPKIVRNVHYERATPCILSAAVTTVLIIFPVILLTVTNSKEVNK